MIGGPIFKGAIMNSEERPKPTAQLDLCEPISVKVAFLIATLGIFLIATLAILRIMGNQCRP